MCKRLNTTFKSPFLVDEQSRSWFIPEPNYFESLHAAEKNHLELISEKKVYMYVYKRLSHIKLYPGLLAELAP